jgi:hypothetical protein
VDQYPILLGTAFVALASSLDTTKALELRPQLDSLWRSTTSFPARADVQDVLLAVVWQAPEEKCGEAFELVLSMIQSNPTGTYAAGGLVEASEISASRAPDSEVSGLFYGLLSQCQTEDPRRIQMITPAMGTAMSRLPRRSAAHACAIATQVGVDAYGGGQA